MFDPKLHIGQTLTNEQLTHLFKVGPEGGMRRSLATGSLVLISNHTTNFYEDQWKGNVFHYTGMGKQGDQSLDFMQNKTLRDSDSNGVKLFLFEVTIKKAYVYQGRVVLAADPYKKVQRDFLGNERSVWIFPLKAIDHEGPKVLTEKAFEKEQEQREKQAHNLSDQELMKRALSAVPKNTTSVLSGRYVRNEYVGELAKRDAKGKCQLCKQDAPFKNTMGEPFLEVHHIDWLSKGGKDTISNTIALCPNCHRRMHVLCLQADIDTLKKSAKSLGEMQ